MLAALRRWTRSGAAEDRPEVVFLGDSITEFWPRGDPALFRRGWVNRGVSGETTREMLARFDRDVIAARPRSVHIMGGTNDLWHGVPGAGAAETIAHIAAMIAAAHAHGIAVVVAAPPPIAPHAQTLLRHAELLRPMMAGIARAAREGGALHVDYAAVLTDRSGRLRPACTTDGIHLTRTGYRAMRKMARQAIRQARDGGGTGRR